MSLHFSEAEFERRKASCKQELSRLNLDAILLFKQESMYYLTGLDSTGYLYFQTLLMGANGEETLLTRSGDLASAQQTSNIEDIRVWVDSPDVDPATEIRKLLEDHGLGGKRIGVEYQAVGLNAFRGQMLDARLEGFCDCVDASDVIDRLRLVKSEEELVYVRESAVLSQAVLETANRLSVPGASLGEVRAGMLATLVEGGGDPPTIRWPMGCGESALMVRYFTGCHDQRIAANDQVTHEFGASYRHYHTALMHLVVTGKPDPRHLEMFAACSNAIEACEETLRPGRTFGDIYDAHAEVLSGAGFDGMFLNTCGYPLGATYPPTWVEQPIIYRNNPLELRPGMVLFMHMILQDRANGLAMSLGETALVTEAGCERLTQAPRELVVN